MGPSALLVSHECPQCGAPVQLEETDRVLSCAFCRVRLMLSGGEFLRYWIPPPASAGDELVLAPYWRFRGIECSFRAEPLRMAERFLDVTVAAAGGGCLPASLGLRPQAMRLRFASPRTPAFFLRPSGGLNEALAGVGALQRANDALAGEAEPDLRELLAETASLVYAPLVIRGDQVFDALLGRELPACRGRAGALLELVDRRRGWQLRFHPALCPECGGGLAGDARSVVLYCRQCRTGFEAAGAGLRRVPCLVAPGAAEKVALPFWRLGVRMSGLGLETGADLARFGNLPRGVVAGGGTAPLRFWAPAFAFHPRLFLRLARQMTVLQPQDAAGEGEALGRFVPVGIAAGRALAVVRAVLAELGVPKRDVFARLAGLEVALESAELVFLPFEERGGDLVQPRMGFAVVKGAVLPAPVAPPPGEPAP